MVHSDFCIFEDVIRISLKVPSIRFVLSKESLTGKNRLSEGHLNILSTLPLKIFKLNQSLMSHKVLYSINEKRIQFSKKCAFWGKKSIFRNSKITPISK